ncbi:MAG: tRNA (adenosine(37)-N6)-dimethylallyltransferase MiaA [Magnetococcales bacterium]|nr:tRNA (adenosine(37)-N6)-dimethylallyltransferase MiaA [Magnetococcales bacterium]
MSDQLSSQLTGPAIFIMGPTASGKSALALTLAQHFPLEIVNADAMQVYRGLDIGTAKPTPVEQASVLHHLLDLVTPDQHFSVGHYRRLALETIDSCRKRGVIPLFVGGSGLYLRALEQGLSPIPPIDETTLQEQLQREGEAVGWPKMHQKLAAIDPQWAARVMPNDRQRIVRGLSVYQATGLSLSYWHQQTRITAQNQLKPVLKIILSWDRAVLYQRIEQRFDHMMDHGLLDEVTQLWQHDYPRDLPAMKAVGYRQLLSYLDGNISSLDEAISLAKQESRRYAKRQLTWLRHDHSDNPSFTMTYDQNCERTAVHLINDFLENGPVGNPLR